MICPVCGSTEAACFSLESASPADGPWCPLWKKAVTKRFKVRHQHMEQQAAAELEHAALLLLGKLDQ